ncbi:MAG: peroxidase [Acidimicrobiia bacterium]
MADRIAEGWRSAGLSPADEALCEYTEKLTRSPAAVGEEDVAALRTVGFDDPAISSATQVIAYFNYINRIAEGLGVPFEAWLNADGTPRTD